MAVAERDEWVRERWKAWFRPTLETAGISLNALSRVLRGETSGDYRSALRAYRDGTVTITADRAFEIGDAIARLSPGSWISGFYAIAIAGYYEELMRVLDVIETNRTDYDGGMPALAAIHIPFLAEFELASLRKTMPSFVPSDGKFVGRQVSNFSMLIRCIHHAYRFATRSSHMFMAFRKALGELTGEEQRTLCEELGSLPRCWELRHEPRTQPNLMDETFNDRRALMTLADTLSTISVHPELQQSVLFEMLWQWANLVNRDTWTVYSFQISLLRNYFLELRRLAHIAVAADAYERMPLNIGGEVGYIMAKKGHEALKLPIEERLDSFRDYDRKSRAAERSRIHVIAQIIRKGGYQPNFKKFEEAFVSRLAASPPPGVSEHAFRV